MALATEPHTVSPNPMPRRATRGLTIGAALVLLCGAVLVSSFLKSDLPRNDFERFDDLRLLFLFFGLVAGLCGVYIAAYAERSAISRRAIVVTTLAAATLLLASFPVGSKDVFGYAFYGKMWGLYQANPYVATPAEFPYDEWQPFLQVRWRHLPTAYGPLFLWQARVVSAIAGDHLWTAVWLHKAAAAAALLATLCVAAAMVRSDALLLLLAWNPLFLFESAGGAHNDVAMVLLVLGALWCWRDGRGGLAMGLLALSFWYKWYGVLFVPAVLIETTKSASARAAVRQAMIGAGAAAVLGLLLLGPLPGSAPAVLHVLLHPGALHGIYPNELSPPLAAIFWTLRGFGVADTELGFRIFAGGRYVLFASAVVLILLRQWRAAAAFAALTESCFLLGGAFFLLLVTMLLPWHLLTVVALGIICERESFLRAAVVLTVLALLSYFLTFAVATLMVALVAGAVWLMRRARPVPKGAVSIS